MTSLASSGPPFKLEEQAQKKKQLINVLMENSQLHFFFLFQHFHWIKRSVDHICNTICLGWRSTWWFPISDSHLEKTNSLPLLRFLAQSECGCVHEGGGEVENHIKKIKTMFVFRENVNRSLQLKCFGANRCSWALRGTVKKTEAL